MHGHSTALPWEADSIEKQDKEQKRKKRKKKKKMHEAKREPMKNPQVDKWLDKVRQLKGSVDDLESEKEKADKEKKKPSAKKTDKPKDKDGNDDGPLNKPR